METRRMQLFKKNIPLLLFNKGDDALVPPGGNHNPPAFLSRAYSLPVNLQQVVTTSYGGFR